MSFFFLIKKLNQLGRSHDSAAFNSSDITAMLSNTRRYFPTDGYLLGDAAYPLSRHLITPYPNSECISNPAKRQFNMMLSASRVSIERAFGLLVARWRIMGFHIYVLDQLDINDVIAACCILHNVCIDRGELQFEPESTQQDLEDEIPLTVEETESARARRDNLLITYFGPTALR